MKKIYLESEEIMQRNLIAMSKSIKENMSERYRPTPTEEAFIKAKELDVIMGYIIERNGELNKYAVLEPCTQKLLDRYQLQFGDRASIVLGLLEKLL